MSTVATQYWHTLSDGRVQCDLCPRFCKIPEGQRGFCFVRACEDHKIVLTTYGRSSGFCVDPIEKKPLHHFFPGTGVLSFGTAGCNLGCKFCQNWDISKSREVDTLAAEATPQRIAQAAVDLQAKAVAFTYNDPVIFMEYAVDVARACHDQGVKTVAVTAGEICAAPRREFFRHIDAANVDLKGFTKEFYQQHCFADFDTVLETLQYLKHETKVWLEITTLLIPGLNDSDQEIQKAATWILKNIGADVPWHFTAFHPDFKMQNIPPTPVATLSRARAIALNVGLNFVYTGNVHDTDGGSTYCPSCKQKVIGRDWYVLGEWQLNAQGQCGYCNTPIAGHFESPPGNFGAKRIPVAL